MQAYKRTYAVLLSFLILVLGPATIAAAELDATFGNDGRVATQVGNYEDRAYAVALQEDGKILVGGSSSNGADLDFALVRYNRDGTMDETFNYDGTVTTQVGRGDDEIAALALQEDGRILAAGYTMQDGSRDFALVRYGPDGQRDATFGLDGIVVTEYGTLDDEITAMTIDDEGRIVVAGYSTGTTGRAVIVGRYLADGSLDPDFGYQGVSLTGIGEDAIARSIDVDDLGRIIVAGSYFHEERTEVMVLRFTGAGKLDTSFGTEGLGLTEYTLDATEGYGVRLHESGAILVAGSVGGPGYFDAALFRFDADGRPDPAFGDSGMLEIEASLEDDMALALDISNDTVFMSGFTTVDGVRQFLFISLQVTSPEAVSTEVAEIESVPFVLKTGNATTSLNIGERQVVDSYDEYFADDGVGMNPIQTTVSQAAFGIFSNDTSFAVAVQPDGMAVAAGVSEEDGLADFAVARFAAETSVMAAGAPPVAGTPTSWLQTKTPFEITRTGAISGGVILDQGISITQRGVVFSIAPDPVLKSGTDGGDGGNGGGEDTTPPVITVTSPSGSLPEGTNQTELSVTTNENATCRFSEFSGDTFDLMTDFSSTGGTVHSTTLTNIFDGDQFFIKCRDSNNNTNPTDTVVTIIIQNSPIVNRALPGIETESIAARLGGLVVGTAMAQIGVVSGSDTSGDSGTTVTSIFESTSDFTEEGFTEDGSGTGSFSSILSNLKPGTFYYIRAYAVDSSGTVYYGDQFGFKTADSCFIATAAYGSLMHGSVKVLRDFRDEYLMSSAAGRMFINLYYTYSPPLADIISGSTVLRAIVRILLLPLVAAGWLFLHLGAAAFVVIAASFILPYFAYRRAWRRA
jgi:uncharacterized delta-60 repeat protein